MADEDKTQEEDQDSITEIKGAFIQSLKRSNKEIKSDRAEAIAEAAQVRYRRTVEDLDLKVKDLKRQRENIRDMSPTNALSLTLAQDFDAGKYVEIDLQLGLDIRNTEIMLEVANRQYNHLFGGN